MGAIAAAEARVRLADVPSTSYGRQSPCRQHGHGRAAAQPPARPRRSVAARSSLGGLPDDISARLQKWAQQLKALQQQQGGSSLEAPSSSSNGSTPDSNTEASRQRSIWNDWSGQDEDWDEWRSQVVVDLEDEDEVAELREAVIERRRQRRGKRTKVRDEYLRPIVDPQGIYNRLAYDEKEVEERVFVEAITNQYESREALKYAAMLVAAPLAVGFAVSRFVAQPLWSYAERIDPEAFAPRDWQKVEGAHEIHLEETRLRMEAALGQAPALTDEAMLEHLQEEAAQIDARMRQGNKQAMLNMVSDSVSAAALFIMLLQSNSQRAILFRTIGRVFTGLSDTAKAFLIILITDTLLGYHSEEGWTAALNLIGGHYGVEAEKESLQLFVAIVPVVLDSLFKVWIFIGLNRQDPAAAVTLRQMDRH